MTNKKLPSKVVSLALACKGRNKEKISHGVFVHMGRQYWEEVDTAYSVDSGGRASLYSSAWDISVRNLLRPPERVAQSLGAEFV